MQTLERLDRRLSSAARTLASTRIAVDPVAADGKRSSALRRAIVLELAWTARRLAALVEAGEERLAAWQATSARRDELARRLRAAEALLTRARAAAAEERQDWGSARSALAQANAHLDAVAAPLEAIALQRALADQAWQTAATELAEAQDAIDRAEAALYVVPSGDRGAFDANLDEAREWVHRAFERTRLHRPDLLGAIRLARRARATAATVLLAVLPEAANGDHAAALVWRRVGRALAQALAAARSRASAP